MGELSGKDRFSPQQNPDGPRILCRRLGEDKNTEKPKEGALLEEDPQATAIRDLRR